MIYYKVIRIKDNKIFYFAKEEDSVICTWLCREDKTIIKPLKDVRDYLYRFRRVVNWLDYKEG